jgi:hypothetical protein
MESMSMGRGNTMVEFFSDEMELSVCVQDVNWKPGSVDEKKTLDAISREGRGAYQSPNS